MADVFVSYSRRDGEFVRRFAEALTERGKDVWVDVDGIRDAEVFPAALRTAVEQSDGFVFVISPDSVASNYCEQEVDHALELNKRIVPLLLRTVPDEAVPEGVRVRNWIPCRDSAEFEAGVARVVEALDTDLGWTKEHTRWLLKALEWDAEGKERSFLLRGSELVAAEGWLAGASGKEPEPTTLQSEYVAASRLAASRRQRTLLAVSGVVTVLSLGLLVFALISRSQAISARNTAKSQAVTAKSQALAADSQTQLAVDPERSILLAVAALHKAVTPEATFALRAALDASPIRFRLPDAGTQTCGFGNIAAPGVAFGGRQLAEGLCNGTVVIADAQTGHVERRIHTGQTGGGIAYSRDGSLLAVHGLTGVELIDAKTGAVRGVGPTVRRIGGRLSVAFSPTAPVVAIGEGGEVALWNVRTRRTRFLRFQSAVGAPTNGLSFSPDGKRLAVALLQTNPTEPGLLLLDVAHGRTLATARGSVDDVAFAPDGQHVVAAETLFPSGKGAIVLHDARTLASTRILAELPAVEASAVAFSPDGSRIAFGGFDGTAGLVTVQTGQMLASYVGQTAAINQVAFSPDGRLVATASTDGTARVWRATGQEQQLIPVGESIAGLATSPGRIEAVIGAGRPGAPLLVQTWTGHEANAGRPLVLSSTGDVGAIFVSGDGGLAATIPASRNSPNAPISIWDVSKRRVVVRVPSARAPFGGEPTFSPDGSAIAMGVPGGIARSGPIGKPPTGAPGRERPGAPPVKPQSLLVVRDVRTGKDRTYGRTSCGTGWRGQTFSRGGRSLAAGSFCGEVYVWNVRTGRPLIQPVSIGGELAAIAFDPDGTRIAVASWNSTIAIVDLRTGRTVAVLTNHTKGVASVAYSPDGRYLASASLDHTARIWDARTLQPLRVFTDPAALNWVKFTPGSREVVTADEANVIRVWDACTACENPRALLALARTRVTRRLTAQERRTFAAG